MVLVHLDNTYGVLSQMLGDFEDQSGFTAFDFKGVQNWWTTICELDVNDWTNDGDDFTAGGDIRGRSNDSTEISRQHPKFKKYQYELIYVIGRDPMGHRSNINESK